MPELPEVETVRLGLERHLLGRKISVVELRRSDLRFPFPGDFASSLQNRVIQSVERRAKYLLIRLNYSLDDSEAILFHTGLTFSAIDLEIMHEISHRFIAIHSSEVL